MLLKTLRSALGLWLLAALAVSLNAQSIISGDVTGIVTDPTGAVVPGATVTLTNTSTNAPQTGTTNGGGSYRFAFVPPGTYKVSVSATGFQTQQHGGIIVAAGQPTSANVQLAVAGASQTVDVVEGGTALQTENADVATDFSTQMIENLPNPGGDITYFVQTAPGVVMNVQGGNGNFSANGMPGTSNLFTINGMSYNDPFLDVNNSGASNLSLGSNDIAEANVINNAYSGQYGQYAGTQVTYITKSGTNEFHGDAIYMWNGRELNANQFFNNSSGVPTPFNNFNQWAAGLQGPIWKNRTFFDVNYEGLRSLLPGSSSLNLIPSPQYQTAALQNLAGNGNAAEIPFYKQIFSIYNNAPGAGSASAAPGGGCGGFTSPLLAASAPCVLEFRNTPADINKEYQWSARVDHIFSEKDRGYVRVSRDNGFQPTFASPFGPTFNEESNQPQMVAQVSETHVFGPNTVNQFNASTLFYAAVFVPSDPSAALSALPAFVNFSGGTFTSVGAYGEPSANSEGFFFPQGRRVFQYQVADDVSHIMGKHTFRVGISWLHDTVTDLDFSALGGPINGAITTSIGDFFNGGGSSTSLFQGFPSASEEGIKFNTLGGYVADDWKVTDRLTVSLNLRLEHYSNPTCDSNCFSHLTSTFTGAADPSAVSTPYNQFIVSGLHNAYPDTQAVVWEPRVGIAWRPFHNSGTVIRTGAGIFADQIEGGLAEDAAFNAPGLNSFLIGNGTLAPGAAGSLFTTAAEANQALLTQFKSGGSFNSISAAVPGFAAPSFTNFPTKFLQPTYYKWNFEIEQSLSSKMLFTINYSGMHGIHILNGNEALNAFCSSAACPNGFVGLPTAPPDAALGVVTQYTNAGVASYNGLSLSLQRRLTAGLTFTVNYTWSHALDTASNGGVVNESFGVFQTNGNIEAPQNPFNLRANYASSDYDIRNSLNANFVLSDMFRHAGFKWGPNQVFGGWTLSSNLFWRSGLPFSIVDSGVLGALEAQNYGTAGTAILASPTGAIPLSCGASAVNTPCFTSSQFTAGGGFGTLGRNTLVGPHFFDMDLALMKSVRIKERLTFSFGAQAYNIANHPNFDQPTADLANPNFGRITAEVAPPTSILGAFVPGTAASPRFVEIKGVIRF
jgi:outer membrane receptor protein involved in Fe transport